RSPSGRTPRLLHQPTALLLIMAFYDQIGAPDAPIWSRKRYWVHVPLPVASHSCHGAGMPEFEALRAIASRQHGLVSRRQTREAGFDRWALARLVRKGHLTFITPRVLRIGGTGASPWESVMAGILDVGFDATAS